MTGVPRELTPSAAVDLHLDLIRGLRTERADEILEGLSEATPSQSAVSAAALGFITERADTFLVTGEMMGLAGHAAVDLDGMPLFAHDLPSRNMLLFLDDVGWDYFSNALLDHEPIDVLGMAMVRALSIVDSEWVASYLPDDGRPGSHVAQQVSYLDPDTGELSSGNGVFLVMWAAVADVEDHMHEHGWLDTNERGLVGIGPMIPVDFSGWGYGLRWESLSEADTDRLKGQITEMPGKVASHVGQMRRRLLSTLLLMGEEVYAERERVSRPTRRRWEASKLKLPEDFSVGVTRLRRYHSSAYDQHPDSEPIYTHRFYVRGHWRRLHRGTPEERAVWVRPYIKGPDHAPLIERFRVTALDR